MKSKYLIVSLFVALTIMVSACAPQATPTQAPPPTTAPATQADPASQAPAVATPSGPAMVNVGMNATFGSILVDDKGMTLYLFTNDTPNTSTCYGKCATYWPDLLTNGNAVGGAGLDSSKFGTTTRTDGTTQVTYNSWPLYYFAKDKQPGDVTGQGVTNNWFVVSPSGDAIKSAAQAGGTQTPSTSATGASSSYLDQFKTLGVVASTVPANGDVNPYGIVVVGATTGNLVQGDVLVSNFNNSGNLQGTGTTIVQIAPDGTVKQFAKLSSGNLPGVCPGGVGLSTALSVLNSGWVIVGSLPTKDGTSATAKAGCLIVLNSKGQAMETLSGPEINGPWDMTAVDNGTTATLFVTNVLNGTVAASPNVVNKGTVLRINLSIPTGKMPHEDSRLVIASDLPEKTDPAAMVVGPTGVALGSDGTLYVADTVQNRIASIPNALTVTSDAGSETTVMSGGDLNNPLGLTIAPNGDILVANAQDGNLVEINPAGAHVSTRLVDAPIGAGTLFGLAVVPGGQGLYFVDDGINELALLNK